MQKNNINLRPITISDDLEGYKVLKELSNDETNMNECPTPKELDENLYKGFLILSEEDRCREDFCNRYWVTLNNKIIGYADIKNPLKDEISDIGNIGIIILKEYRNKGIGLEVMRQLIEKAKNEFNLKNISVSTDKNNVSMRRLCEKINGELLSEDDKCNYNIK